MADPFHSTINLNLHPSSSELVSSGAKLRICRSSGGNPVHCLLGHESKQSFRISNRGSRKFRRLRWVFKVWISSIRRCLLLIFDRLIASAKVNPRAMQPQSFCWPDHWRRCLRLATSRNPDVCPRPGLGQGHNKVNSYIRNHPTFLLTYPDSSILR